MAATMDLEELKSDLLSRKSVELKKMLKERSLPTTGKKEDMVLRLLPYLESEVVEESGANNSDEVAEVDEDEELLGDDDIADVTGDDYQDQLLEDEESIEQPDEESIEEPDEAPVVEDGGGEVGAQAASGGKKISLGKRVAQPTSTTSDDATIEGSGVSVEAKQTKLATKEDRAKRFGLDEGKANGVAVKGAVLSKEERAKKFGIISKDGEVSPPSGTADTEQPIKNITNRIGILSKEERAKKFGGAAEATVSTTTSSVGGVVGSEKIFNAEAKAKRAERFGIVSESKTSGNPSEDAKLKRAERFGGDQQITSGSASWKSSSTYKSLTEEEKRKMRLEKFK